jgi:hypothetical protein
MLYYDGEEDRDETWCETVAAGNDGTDKHPNPPLQSDKVYFLKC